MVFIQDVLGQVVQDIKDQVGIPLLATDRPNHPEVRERIRLDHLLDPNENVERRVGPHPSHGGSEGYDFHMRASAIIHRIQGHPVTPSDTTIKRWIRNGVMRKMKRGGPKRKFQSQHLLLLTIFLLAHPDATLEECKAFLYCNTNGNMEFSRWTIARALKSINYTRKKASTVATQAFTEVNLQRRYNYWNQPFPYGIVGTPRRRIIDTDECGFHLSDCNRKYGYAASGVRVIKKGHYSKSAKLTLICSIESGDPDKLPHELGSLERPRIWYRIAEKGGTSLEDYCSYIEGVIDTFEDTEPQRTFIHDNLSSHIHHSIRDLIHGSGHRVVRRPPYYPCDAPIEFFLIPSSHI